MFHHALFEYEIVSNFAYFFSGRKLHFQFRIPIEIVNSSIKKYSNAIVCNQKAIKAM